MTLNSLGPVKQSSNVLLFKGEPTLSFYVKCSYENQLISSICFCYIIIDLLIRPYLPRIMVLYETIPGVSKGVRRVILIIPK